MESEDMDNQIMRLDTSGYLVEDDTTYIVNSDDVLGEANTFCKASTCQHIVTFFITSLSE